MKDTPTHCHSLLCVAGKHGVDDIKKSGFFKKIISWQSLLTKKIEAPYKPVLKDELDVSQVRALSSFPLALRLIKDLSLPRLSPLPTPLPRPRHRPPHPPLTLTLTLTPILSLALTLSISIFYPYLPPYASP